MARVTLTSAAAKELDELPTVIHARVLRIIDRLAAWPDVSGAKPLSGDLAGQHRIRTGDYRVQFRASGETVTVVRIGHRDGFYDD
jgi:mRNA-degrading endonuclease RelE of RelBE toxin-antitoxin system